MERDFMGLKSRDCVVVKEEFAAGGCEDSGFARSSGVPWLPLPSKMFTIPHFMSPKPEQAEKPLKMKPSFLTSLKSGSVTFDMNNKPSEDNQNLGGTMMMPQVLDDGSLTAAAPNHTSAGDISKPSTNSGAQFTIFYNGTVHVFDDFSPEKAQAIIFLAGNGCVPSNMSPSKYQMQENKPLSMNPPSPFSAPSNPAANISAAPNSRTKLSSMGSFTANDMISSGVPQSRKASLARFLEKRRERTMNASPYNMSKKPI